MEFWDIYDSDKKQTGRTMKRNDWNLKNGEYHLTVLGVIHRPDGRFLITRRVMTKAWAPGWWEAVSYTHLICQQIIKKSCSTAMFWAFMSCRSVLLQSFQICFWKIVLEAVQDLIRVCCITRRRSGAQMIQMQLSVC